MKRRRRLLAIGVAIGLVAVYFAWGRRLETEYLRRVVDLRGSGGLEAAQAPIPPEENRVVLSCSLAVPGAVGPESLRSFANHRLMYADLLVWEVRWAP